MQKKNYLLAALDMDGTLLNSDHVSTPYTQAMLRRAADAGRIMAISTGRAMSELSYHLPTLSAVRYIISVNGAAIHDVFEHRCVSRTPIDDEDVLYIFDLRKKYDMVCELYLQDQAYVCWHEPDDLTPYHVEHFRPVFEAGCIFDENAYDRFISGVTPMDKMNIYFRTPEERAFMRGILEARNLAVADSIGIGLEISRKGVTKAEGLKVLCKYLNIDLADTMAIGDAGNDLQVMTTAGLGVAMGNSTPEIMAIAGAVTDDCDHDGAAKAIERFMLAE